MRRSPLRDRRHARARRAAHYDDGQGPSRRRCRTLDSCDAPSAARPPAPTRRRERCIAAGTSGPPAGPYRAWRDLVRTPSAGRLRRNRADTLAAFPGHRGHRRHRRPAPTMSVGICSSAASGNLTPVCPRIGETARSGDREHGRFQAEGEEADAREGGVDGSDIQEVREEGAETDEEARAGQEGRREERLRKEDPGTKGTCWEARGDERPRQDATPDARPTSSSGSASGSCTATEDLR
jgi:hypothetical protein